MTNREQAQMSMFIALDKELTDDESVYQGDADYVAEVAAFRTAFQANKDAAEKAHVDNSGFSQDKLNQKLVLSQMASNLSGKAYVKFVNLNKLNLAEQMSTEPTDYSIKADSVCATLAQKAHDVMHDNLADLSPNTVTDANLVDLQKEIDKFTELKGSSEIVHEVSPELTQQFKDSFKPVMVRVDHLKLLTRDYKSSNPGFYTRLMASTKIPTINVHHTYVGGHVTRKSDGKPILGAVFSLTKGGKSDTTDHEGDFLIEEVKAGEDTLTGVLDGNVVYTGYITIKRGKTNHFDVVIE